MTSETKRLKGHHQQRKKERKKKEKKMSINESKVK